MEPVTTTKAAIKIYRKTSKVSKKTTGKPLHYWLMIAWIGFLALLILPLLMFIPLFGGGAAAAACDNGEGLLPGSTVDYNGDIAAELYHVAKSLGVSDRVMLAMYETALVESGMRNLPGGDRDSVGVFQQRPSQGWGTIPQIMNVTYSTRTFLLGKGGTPQKPRGAIGLDRTWTSTPGLLAQAIQRSCCPNKYDKREREALTIIARMKAQFPDASLAVAVAPGTQMVSGRARALAGSGDPRDGADPAAEMDLTPGRVDAPPAAPLPGQPAAGQSVINYQNPLGPPSSEPTPAGVKETTAAAAAALRQWGFGGRISGLGNRPNNPSSDHPKGYATDVYPASRAQGDRLAEFYLRNLDPLKVKYIIWYGRIYDLRRPKPWQWVGYTKHGGHYDHLHISYNPGMAVDVSGVSADVPNECVNEVAIIAPTPGSSSGEALGGYSLPLPRERLTRNYVSKPHHDYPASDMPTPMGTQVFAVRGGKVASISRAGKCGYGVTIAADDGSRHVYCHGSEIQVTQGQDVPTGGAIMASGGARGHPGAGSSTGPHLHFGIRRDGVSVCPQGILIAVFEKTAPPTLASLPNSGCTY